MKKFDPVENLANARHELGEYGGVNMSIEASTTFTAKEADILKKIFQGQLGPDMGGCYLYGRSFNPTVYGLGELLAAMEGTEAGYCTASGMSAITSSILQLCESGDHVIASSAIYGGTYALFNQFLPKKFGLEVTFVDISDENAIKKAFKANTKVVYTESLSNPTLKVPNLPELAKVTHAHGAKLVVDNTFCPFVLSPSQYGADIVVHSLTKFINGASDIIAGAICSDKETIKSMMDLEMGPLMIMGPTLDPRQAFNISLRIPHLAVRMQEHSRRGMIFSERIRDLGLKIAYPGLKSHPQHQLFTEMANPEFGYGGIFSIDFEDEALASKVMEVLQKNHFGYLAVSLGYYETLMSCSGSSTSSELPDSEKKTVGISPGLLRISIGLTGTVEQRWEQFEQSLKQLGII